MTLTFNDLSPRDRIRRFVLHEGLDDWVAFGWVLDEACRAGSDIDATTAGEWAVGVIAQMASDGLARAGQVGDAGFTADDDWPGRFESLRADLASGRPVDHYACWVCLTALGRTEAESLEPDWALMIEEEAHRTSAST